MKSTTIAFALEGYFCIAKNTRENLENAQTKAFGLQTSSEVSQE